MEVTAKNMGAKSIVFYEALEKKEIISEAREYELLVFLDMLDPDEIDARVLVEFESLFKEKTWSSIPLVGWGLDTFTF